MYSMAMKSQYHRLCAEFLSVAQLRVDDDAFNAIKDYYKTCINSKRKFSQIKDLNALMNILEKRDTLSYVNIEPLVNISNNFLKDSHVYTLIKDYISDLNTEHSTYFDMYKDENEHASKLTQKTEVPGAQEECQTSESGSSSQIYTKNLKSYSTQEEILQRVVFSQICEKIGRSWRDTVRYLGVPEYQIDNIQNKYPLDMKEQSYKALRLYISEYCIGDWKLKLIHALERARRRDLKELVEKLIISKQI
ncbi:fas-associated death domain protein [Augochlora pura]